jgi:hypothetical protein
MVYENHISNQRGKKPSASSCGKFHLVFIYVLKGVTFYELFFHFNCFYAEFIYFSALVLYLAPWSNSCRVWGSVLFLSSHVGKWYAVLTANTLENCVTTATLRVQNAPPPQIFPPDTTPEAPLLSLILHLYASVYHERHMWNYATRDLLRLDSLTQRVPLRSTRWWPVSIQFVSLCCRAGLLFPCAEAAVCSSIHPPRD